MSPHSEATFTTSDTCPAYFERLTSAPESRSLAERLYSEVVVLDAALANEPERKMSAPLSMAE